MLGSKRGGILVANNGSDEGSKLGRKTQSCTAPKFENCLKEISVIEYEFLFHVILFKLEKVHIAGKECGGQTFNSATNEQSQ